MVDLSDKMVELSKKRVTLALSGHSLNDSLDRVIATEINEGLLKNNNIEVVSKDCSDLSFIKSSSIDAYVSGLMFHLAPNPEDLVKEAARVVKPNGKFSFSVFGDKSKSLYFSMFDDLMTREGVMTFRSKFHLNDEQKISKMLLDHGFTAIKFIRQELPFSDAFVSNTDEHFEMPANKAMLKNLDSSKVESLRKEMR
jgi:SAM-dependent methyltransferase